MTEDDSANGPRRAGGSAGVVRRKPDPWLETLAWLMDRSIPLGRWSIGLDGLLGLIPGAGDTLGALVSAAIVARAATSGLPRSAVARMALNVLIDTLLGAIPLAGDVFDFAFKANSRNLQIFREALEGQRRVSPFFSLPSPISFIFTHAHSPTPH